MTEYAPVALQEAYETGLVVFGIAVLAVVVVFLWWISPKVLGFLMVLMGLFVLRYYPRMSRYQPHQFRRAGLVVGFALIAAGVAFIAFF